MIYRFLYKTKISKDTILLKPGKLTKEEYEIIKKHTIYGYTIIEDTLRGIEKDKYVNLAEEVALNHHERWDGKGYPNGLKGEHTCSLQDDICYRFI